MATEIFKINKRLNEGLTTVAVGSILFGRKIVSVDREGTGQEIVSPLDTPGPREVKQSLGLGYVLTFGTPGAEGGEDIEILYTRVT